VTNALKRTKKADLSPLILNNMLFQTATCFNLLERFQFRPICVPH
jgi:hypothetical protein